MKDHIEKIKSIMGIVGSIIFIMSLVLIFSCEGKKTISEHKEVHGDTTTITRTEVYTDSSSGNEQRFREESNDIEMKLRALGEKAKQKGGALGKSIKERTEKLEAERKGYRRDSTHANSKDEWNTFKEKARAAIDSLEKKLNH
jgi:hypothetical protein